MNKKTNTKFYLLVSLALLGSLPIYVQAQEVKSDTARVEEQNKSRFWDNWFAGAGAGLQTSFDDHNKQMKFTETLVPNFSLYLGKWVTPSIGARIGLNGFKMKGLTQNGSHSTGVRYDGKPWQGYWLENQGFNYFQLHGDVLFNLSNIFGGYKEDRFYEISPYLGLGWMVVSEAPKANELSGSLGIFNTFRISKGVNLTLDVRSNLVNDRFDGELGGRKREGSLAALAGLQIKL